MFCHKCGTGNPNAALFCNKCGTTMQIANPIDNFIESLPISTINFPIAVLLGIRKYFQIHGRSRRAEFWWFVLFVQLCGLSGMISLTGHFIGPIASLVVIIPSITITTRRLHDMGKSGWLQLVYYLGIWASLISSFTFLLSGFSASGSGKSNLSVSFFICSVMSFIALITILFLWIRMLSQDGEPRVNKYGVDPKGREFPPISANH